MRKSAYLIALLLFVLAFMGCSKLQSDVTSFSEKVKEKFQAKKKETVTASHLNLRKGPSTQSPTLSVFRQGDQLEIYHISGKWAKVQTYDGSEGWVYARYITGFEDLFTEKQDATETQQSTRKSKTKQPIPPESPAVEQEVVSDDDTAWHTKEISDPDASASEKPFSLPENSEVNTPPDERDAVSQPGSGAQIEPAKSPTLPELEPGEDAQGKIISILSSQSPAGDGRQFVFSHPAGLFSLRMPAGWDNNIENQNYFEKYIFTDPAQDLEIWVVHTPAEDYSEGEFYRDLASLQMERSGARTEISPSTRRKADSGLEWLYGKVEIKSEPIRTHEYWIKEHNGRIWAITEVYPQTKTETASKKLFEIRHSFAFGEKSHPNQ